MRRSERGPAGLDDPLGDRIDMAFDLDPNVSIIFVQGDELRPLDVPLGLLGQSARSIPSASRALRISINVAFPFDFNPFLVFMRDSLGAASSVRPQAAAAA